MLDVENIDTNDEASEGRIYEVSYLVVPTMPEEEAFAVYGDLKDSILATGANIIMDETPKLMPLAYTMVKVIKNVHNKFDKGYFGWTKFELDADKLEDLKKKLDEDDRLIRFLIIKTVRENTIAGKRIGTKDVLRRKVNGSKKLDKKDAVEIDKEEIDKEIDTLIEA